MYAIRDFREDFPLFSEELFADGRVEFHLRLARKQLNPERWEDLLPEGLGLFVAHYLTLEAEARKAGDGAGGIRAAAGPAVAESLTKTAGGVSTSASVTRAGPASADSPGAGHWNLTVYGRQFWSLLQIVGAGGTVV